MLGTLAIDSTLLTTVGRAYKPTLTAERQEAIVARFELGCSYAEVAILLGKSGAEAARKFIARAVVELAYAMKHDA